MSAFMLKQMEEFFLCKVVTPVFALNRYEQSKYLVHKFCGQPSLCRTGVVFMDIKRIQVCSRIMSREECTRCKCSCCWLYEREIIHERPDGNARGVGAYQQ